ncbi:hypothetical protein [Celerinatantimonas sp. YJH-8]|uniref:hypothetical protein n=1 Tax=Celerinatantimonas sp. YJH-8 TaxID=3228714 RepID=UPI0038C945F8
MLYKFTIGIALLIFTLSCSAAQTWEHYLKQQLQHDYALLNQKVSDCRAQRQPLKRITQPWFTQLNKSQKYAAASYLAQLVKERCYKDALQAYSASLLEYSAETGDQSDLKKWLPFIRVYRTPQLDEAFKQLDITAIQHYLHEHPATQPFSVLQFLRQYPEFAK